MILFCIAVTIEAMPPGAEEGEQDEDEAEDGCGERAVAVERVEAQRDGDFSW